MLCVVGVWEGVSVQINNFKTFVSFSRSRMSTRISLKSEKILLVFVENRGENVVCGGSESWKRKDSEAYHGAA